ncbi:thymidylate synthase-like [Culicoides brevitarsis]|uniref:thymidylate synthase-like n=1 Tax=Culicoides brevitarsis TaxID=469753 RepID=UPI00307B8A1E
MTRQYLNIVKKILATGYRSIDRTKVGTFSTFGEVMRFDISKSFPLLTTRKISWNVVTKELLWFISGSTDAKVLDKNGVKIWNANSTKEFLATRQIFNREAGDIGPTYGFQWRHAGIDYKGCGHDYTNQGIDQLQNVIDSIKNDPNNRRMLISSWDVKLLSQMALPPCHVLIQFYVSGDKLSSQLYQRSADIMLGVPYNIASYALLTYMIAHLTNLKPDKFIHIMGNTHLYLNHVDAATQLIEREPYDFPTLKIKNDKNDISDYKYEDFILENYKYHPHIKMDMAV